MKHRITKSLILAPVLLCAAPFAALLPSLSTTPTRVLATEKYEGKIVRYAIANDGTVSVRLGGTRDKKAFSLWFATPASRNDTTRYEHLVLDAVLAARGQFKELPVTIISERGNGRSGETPEDALPLDAIRQ